MIAYTAGLLRLLYYSPHVRGDFAPFLACVLQRQIACKPQALVSKLNADVTRLKDVASLYLHD